MKNIYRTTFASQEKGTHKRIVVRLFAEDGEKAIEYSKPLAQAEVRPFGVKVLSTYDEGPGVEVLTK